MRDFSIFAYGMHIKLLSWHIVLAWIGSQQFVQNQICRDTFEILTGETRNTIRSTVRDDLIMNYFDDVLYGIPRTVAALRSNVASLPRMWWFLGFSRKT